MKRRVNIYKEWLMRSIRTLGCVFALATLVAVGARADENDRLTYLTFSGPVQLPGVTLAAGTYTFKLADLSGGRHVVHVMTKEESPKLITTLMTIPNQRLEPVKDTYIMFQERPAGMPQAMQAWFYPGRSIGEEFIYPKSQAVEIARANNTSVLSSEGDKVGRVTSSGNFEDPAATAANAAAPAASAAAAAPDAAAPIAEAPAAAPAAEARAEAAAPAARAEVVTPAPASPARVEPRPVGTAGQEARTLPRTASPLALFELISALSLAGAAGLRQLRKRA
jgi:hypothetical protein